MRLITGLGNPGTEYALTRHNVGWNVIDSIANSLDAGRPSVKFEGALWSLNFKGERLLLLKPYTYMNNSGISVRQAAAFYKIPAEEILVVSDDINLPLGKMRLRAKGSAGGHNGLKSIIAHLGSQDFPRLRIGVDPCPPNFDQAAWVLGHFSKSDRATVDKAISYASDFCLDWCTSSIEKLMNRVNNCNVKNGEA